MKRVLLVAVWILFIQSLFADIPTGYYNSATGTGYALKTQLYTIIDGHTTRTYTELWTDLQSTDKKANAYVWDMYSDVPGGSPAYDYTFVTDQCGNYSGEGSCYNREHSFPKSWFNDASPMYTDLFHLYPTDGYVNGRRSNYPFGEVGSASWTSTNGSKLGACNYPGYTGTVFEPIDEYKGDFARTYLYMATRYENVIATWQSNDANGDAILDGSPDRVYEEWYLNMILEWHNTDPVSQKELDRNDAVYGIQGNRNPFIDHPEYAAQIWGGNSLPSITEVSYSPLNPGTSDAVGVTAIITDADGTISNAELKWGLSSGSLTNTIAMLVSSGNSYTSQTDIPAQAQGTVVYFEIKATDNASGLTTTSEQSYVVSDQTLVDVMNEDFSSCTLTGWLAYSVASDKDWTCGTGSESINGYGGSEASNDWLVMPKLNLDTLENEIIRFNSWNKYADSFYPPIALKYSTDYTGSGNPEAANWSVLSASWSVENSQTWTSSGDVDLSGIEGSEVYIAFHYTSSGTGAGTSAQWEIDDVVVRASRSTNINYPPQISQVSHSPSVPTKDDDVTLSATIIDTDGTISSATIHWGTSYGTYPNEVSISPSADVYSGIVPAQASGTLVYYRIQATDDEGLQASHEGDYSVLENIAPQITSVSHSPSAPTKNDVVSLVATIIDTDGAISSATINWGTSTGVYPNVVSMSPSADVYSGLVPAQASGTLVYYRIQATDDEGLQASYEGNYSVSENIAPQITEVSHSPTAPTKDDEVSLSASIVDTDGTISGATINWGTSTGVYPNVVSMSSSADVYSGLVPAQASGTLVYYRIQAEDDEGLQASYEGNYEVSESNAVFEIVGYDFKLFPNPASQFVNINIKNYSGVLKIIMYDILGVPALITNVEFSNEYRLPLEDLDSGIYFVKFEFNNVLITKRIIVEE